MAINGRRNKPFGPGGGTRRLHQVSVRDFRVSIGSGLWTETWRGRNRLDEGVKVVLSLGMVSAVIGPNQIVANDNYAEARLAA